ncbi:MAG TPA: 2,3-bisphosphoglycerate-independent phosphoglycerate mutase [Methanomicrobia archaeon]|nr:2,3-bisphosphoglycerate-independent phosphoglycerate mutase [Methanomicrobia archaeon]
MSTVKLILIIADGIGDVPIREFNYLTPLEHGTFPHLDRLAREGICGMMHPLRRGLPAGSDTAHIAILGQDPLKTYRGRGYLEALGVGIEPTSGAIGFRVNFGTVEDGIVTDRRAGRSPRHLDELSREVRETVDIGVPFSFRAATGTRAALVLEDEGLSPEVSDGDPHHTGVSPLTIEPLDGSDAARRTASLLNSFVSQAYEVLRDHRLNAKRIDAGDLPANFLLVRGAGVRPAVPTFQEQFGASAACIAATALIRGVARCYGFDLIDVPEVTGEYDTNAQAKAEATIEALRSYDFVFTHFKPTDTASHDGDPVKKEAMIKKLDAMMGTIISSIPDPHDTVIALTGDHSSPCVVKDHSGEDVPFVMWGGRVRTDDVGRFDERSCARGGLGHIFAEDIVYLMMNQANKVKKFGA